LALFFKGAAPEGSLKGARFVRAPFVHLEGGGKDERGMSTEAHSPPNVAEGDSRPGAVTLYRLTRRWQFLATAKGAYSAKGAVLVQMRPRDDGDGRIGLGFTATRKIGGAVVRNRAKRRLREVARALAPELALPGSDYVFIARNGAPDRPFPQLIEDARRALKDLAKPRSETRTKSDHGQ
jgi:ribonuclease P protein component